MGLFSKVGGFLSNITGATSKIGGFLNDITGATSAGAQSQKYALESAQINNAYQKEFAKNAHQWEVEDLKKAGLNPILSAGGSGTSASGGGVASASEISAGLSPMDALTAGVNAYAGIQNARQIRANTEYTNANTLLTKAKTQSELLELAIKTKASPQIIAKFKADLELTQKQITQLGTGAVSKFLGTDMAKEGMEATKGFFEGIGDTAWKIMH